ncbi:MAG: capsule assembly Wzi family protein, partial [Bacteroidota bacterium]
TSSLNLKSQDTDILLNHELYPYLDRLDIKGLTDTSLSSFLKPYGRDMIKGYFSRIDTNRLTGLEWRWHQQMRMLADDELAVQQKGKGLLKHFYKNKRDLYHYSGKDLTLFINPAIYALGGLDNHNFSTGSFENLPVYFNSRGLVIRGSLMNKIGFYTEVYDNIARVPQFLFNRYEESQVLFGEGFVKRFGSENGLDFLSSRAYITFRPIQAIRLKLGKDRAFWGDGYQSLMLSDHAADYFFLNLHTKIWKLEYVNHFTQMTDFVRDRNDTEGTYPRKFAVYHHLQYHPNSKLSIGIFESIVYNPWLANGRRGFELSYLNPVIFYRSAEQSIGSPDNSFLGLQLKYNFLKRFQFYGQFLLDDFNFGRRNDGDGFIGNKWGYQAGLKYIDVLGLTGLDIQAEYNRLRPFTYQHFNLGSNYTHFAQNLGHAAGANLYDYHFILRYRPYPRWSFQLILSQILQGLDQEADGINYGGNPNRPFINWPDEFGNEPGQGVLLDVRQAFAQLSYQLGQSDNYIEATLRYRRESLETVNPPLRSLSGYLGLRMSIVGKALKF